MIDLTVPSRVRTEAVDPVDTTLGMEEPVTSVYATLPELTQVPTLSAPLTTPLPVHTTVREDDYIMVDLDRHFHPTLPKITALIPSVSNVALTDYKTLTPAVIGATTEQMPSPIYATIEPETHVPLAAISPMLGSSGTETPVCDTAPPVPTIPVSFATSDLGELFAPFPVTTMGQMEDPIATILAFLFEEPRLMYDELYARYREIFETRDTLLRIIVNSRPVATISEEGVRLLRWYVRPLPP
uniref:Uncharacterized protein n=1 Tax=Daucus carota subsp. sativus TaxID=79200 RepID=A0A164TKR7_DAUCS